MDEREALEGLRTSEAIAFPLLMDPESATIRAYGVLNEADGAIPHPSTFVIGAGGLVAWRVVEPDYRRRPPTADVIAAVRAAREAETAPAPAD